VAAFDERAAGYDAGWLGQLHREIADRTATVALACQPQPGRVLDVGCGPGYLLRQLAARLPGATGLTGKARTRHRATALIRAAGLQEARWHRCYAVIIQTVTAVKPG
jgi:cyclopropane fatty-acyl-phospholipid synthase-like methyltransferase